MNTYKRYWFPPDIISYAVWRYYRFNLSHRDIEDFWTPMLRFTTCLIWVAIWFQPDIIEISEQVRLMIGQQQWHENIW
jgi:hypothetical protein